LFGTHWDWQRVKSSYLLASAAPAPTSPWSDCYQQPAATIELAITGAALDRLRHDTSGSAVFEQVLAHTRIFSRMRPEQKQLIVELIAERGRCVGMCGDGANDCSALKVADVCMKQTQLPLALCVHVAIALIESEIGWQRLV
jgi:hypothetical protein